jgi:hypothetical protein
VEKELKKEREENRILKQRLKTQKEEEAEKKETTKGMRARWNDDDQRCSKDRAKK